MKRRLIVRMESLSGSVGAVGVAQGAEPLDGGGGGAHVLVHVEAQTQVAQEEEGFLGADEMGVLEQGHGAGDFVVEECRAAWPGAACGRPFRTR